MSKAKLGYPHANLGGFLHPKKISNKLNAPVKAHTAPPKQTKMATKAAPLRKAHAAMKKGRA